MTPDTTSGAPRYAGLPRDASTQAQAGPGHPATETLRLRYEAYVLRQGRELLTLMPREGVRALVRRIRAELPRETEPNDPLLDDLARYAATLLPLPPFGVWLGDFTAHRAAHLAQTDPPLRDGPEAPDGESVAVDVRSFSATGEEWIGELQVRSVPAGWRGSLHFHRPGAAKSGCTGEVFRERDLTTLRERFRSLDTPTLQAFLRSSLP